MFSVPPTGRVWHKAFLKVNSGAGPQPRQTQYSPKCLGPHGHSPKKSRLRCHAINLTPPKRVKACLDAPLKLEVCPERRHTRPDPCRWYHGPPKRDPSTGFSWLKSTVFVLRPTDRMSVAQGLFKAGFGRRAVA